MERQAHRSSEQHVRARRFSDAEESEGSVGKRVYLVSIDRLLAANHLNGLGKFEYQFLTLVVGAGA